MLNKILPVEIHLLLSKIGYEKINEIRLRANNGILVGLGGKYEFLNSNGELSLKQNSKTIICSQKIIDDIVFKSSEYSIYSINEELKNGFIILKNGIRLGICGSIVNENNQIKTMKEFSSLNIRIPHFIEDCSKEIFNKTYSSQNLKNILIISPPGQGKTTILRDLIYQFKNFGNNENILVCDERGEICAKNFENNISGFCDVLSFCDKKTAFLMGIRSMNPHIIITDELGLDEDYLAVKMAVNSGIKLIASIHARNIYELKNKQNYSHIREIFDYYVCLRSFGKPGQVEAIFDKNYNKV